MSGKSKTNTRYLRSWIVASLCMPALVALFGGLIPDYLVLAFWPGSILLLSLGAGPTTIMDMLYVWIIGVGLNILLYLMIGCLVIFLRYCYRKAIGDECA